MDITQAKDQTAATSTTLTNLLNAPEPVPTTYTVREIFNFPSQMELPGYEPGHPLVPQAMDSYIWSPGLAKDCIEWVCDPDPEPLWVSGPTGCGKTEALKQLFAKLHIPTVIVSAKKSTEPEDILGRVQLIAGNTVFTPGPLLQAYAQGYAIIFDEVDGYPAEVLMACHRLLEKAPVTLDDGTIITPASRVLMAATANTRGDGQGGDVYAATSVFNLATLNRFEKLHMGYPLPAIEKQILQGALPTLDDKAITAMIKVAADIRISWHQGSCPGPISIRDLKRWGRKLLLGANRTDVPVVYHAFDKAFGNGVDEHVRAMLHKLVQSHFNIPVPEISERQGGSS